MGQIRLRPGFQKQAGFYAKRFRHLQWQRMTNCWTTRSSPRSITPGSQTVAEVEAAAARMGSQSEVVILAASILLSAAVVRLSTARDQVTRTHGDVVFTGKSLFLALRGFRLAGRNPRSRTREPGSERLARRRRSRSPLALTLSPFSIQLQSRSS